MLESPDFADIAIYVCESEIVKRKPSLQAVQQEAHQREYRLCSSTFSRTTGVLVQSISSVSHRPFLLRAATSIMTAQRYPVPSAVYMARESTQQTSMQTVGKYTITLSAICMESLCHFRPIGLGAVLRPELLFRLCALASFSSLSSFLRFSPSKLPSHRPNLHAPATNTLWHPISSSLH